MRLGRVLVAMLVLWPLGHGLGRARPTASCARAAIARSEAAGALPAGLLTAVAASEFGPLRPQPARRGALALDGQQCRRRPLLSPARPRRSPMSSGCRRAGERNIDVGCMQINLMHHPERVRQPGRGVRADAQRRLRRRFLGELQRGDQLVGARGRALPHRRSRAGAGPIARRSTSAGRRAPPDAPPGLDDTAQPRLLLAEPDARRSRGRLRPRRASGASCEPLPAAASSACGTARAGSRSCGRRPTAS